MDRGMARREKMYKSGEEDGQVLETSAAAADASWQIIVGKRAGKEVGWRQ